MQDELRTRRKILVRYAAVTIFCLIVSVVYNHFSHGIHSFWMRCLALWPLIFGVLPAFLLAQEAFPFAKKRKDSKDKDSRAGKDSRDREEGADIDSAADTGSTGKIYAAETMKDVYRFGIAAVTLASFLKGVLEIAGTDSLYPDVLFYAGIVMLVCGATGFLFLCIRKRSGRRG